MGDPRSFYLMLMAHLGDLLPLFGPPGRGFSVCLAQGGTGADGRLISYIGGLFLIAVNTGVNFHHSPELKYIVLMLRRVVHRHCFAQWSHRASLAVALVKPGFECFRGARSGQTGVFAPPPATKQK